MVISYPLSKVKKFIWHNFFIYNIKNGYKAVFNQPTIGEKREKAREKKDF